MNTKNENRDMHSESMADPEFRLQFEREWYVEEFLGRIEDRMNAHGITRKALAERLKISAARVTQLFRRENNLTAETMVDLALAVGLRLRAHLDPAEAAAPWSPVVACEPWTESDGGRVIRFPLRKTAGGGVSAGSIGFPDFEPRNEPSGHDCEAKLAR